MTKKDIFDSYKRALTTVKLDKTIRNSKNRKVRFKNKEYVIPEGAYIIDETDDNIARWFYMNEIISNLISSGQLTNDEVIECVREAYGTS